MENKRVSAFANAGSKVNRATKKLKENGRATLRDYEKNQGGIPGTIGYIAGRAGIDFLRVGEGVLDAAAAPFDLIRGDVDMAKSRFLDSPVDAMRERLDREYNPGKVAGFIGDIAGGIGQSIGYGLISAIPYAGTPMMYSSIVEQSISSAAEQTGEVGWKEVGYGATAGAVEGLLESKLGAGVNAVKSIGSAILKKTGVNLTKSAAKAGGKTMLKSVLTDTAKGFAGEFAEEAISEAIDPLLLRRFGIDENAKGSIGDVLYAGLIGGLSGGIMSVGPAAINYRSAVSAGRAIQESRKDGDLIKRAKYTLSALEAAQTRAEGQKKGKPEGDTKETAKEWLSRTAENRKIKRLSKETAQLADKIRRNIAAYEKSMADPAMAQSEPVAAILGELRGNLFLVGYAYEADVIEQVMMDATDEQRQAFVDAINEVLDAQGKKHDYTLADFDANKDDIRRGLAGRLMMDELMGNTAEGVTEYGAKATKDTTSEQVTAKEENAATEATEAAEPDPWESIEGIEGFGTQNAQEEALLRAASSQGVPKRTVPAMLKSYREGTDLTPAEFAEAWGDGVMFFGRLGLNESAIKKDSTLDRIGETARRASIQEGKTIADEELKRAKEKADKKKMPARNQADAKRKQEGRGAVVKGKGLIVQDLDTAQYAAYKAAETFAAVLGTDIVIETDLKTDTGKQINGFYSQKTNGIHININAKRNGQSIALYTLGHEVTHYIKEWSPEKFKALSDFVLNQLGDKAPDLIAAKAEFLRKMPEYKDYTVTQLNDLAVEEVVADSMELVLSDGKIMDELARTEKTVWQKIKDFITKIIADIRKYYGELNQASKTAQVLKETVDSLDEIEQLFYEGVTEAGERTRTAGIETVTRMNEKNMHDSPDVIFSKDGYSADEIENRIADNKVKVLKMSPVSNVEGTEFAKGEVDLVTQVTKYFESKNNACENEELGTVKLTRTGAKSDIAHGIGRKKAASFNAVPDVISEGKIVDYQRNWKNRGYDTAVVVAPITIAGDEYLMGCVVIRAKEDNTFYLHEVAQIKKDGTPSFKTGSSNKSNPSEDVPSVISILQNLVSVKTSAENSTENSFDNLYSMDETSDTAYLAAVERGDMETAQRMVDEAAKAAGYAVKAAHYTDASFTEFDPDKIGSSQDDGYFGKGFYFTSRSGFGNSFGENRMNVYLSAKNPLVISELSYSDKRDLYEYITEHPSDEALESGFEMREEDGETVVYNPTYEKSFGYYDLDSSALHHGYFGTVFSQAITDWAQRNGYDAIFSENPNGDGSEVREIVLFGNRKVKSADPVTYDDNGNVIPLSERFKADNPDIRYSIEDTPETPDVSESELDEVIRRAGLSHLIEDTDETENTETAPPPRKATRERDPEEDRLDRIRAHETLANALMEAAQNEHEFRLVKNYKQKTAELAEAEVRKEDLLKKTAEVNREIDTLQSKLKGVDKTKREPWVMTALTDAQKRKGELLDEMDALDEKLLTETDKLLSLASAKQLRKMFRAERSKAAAMERSAERARQREMDSKEWAKETVKKAREESDKKVKKARQESQDYKAAVYKTSMEKVYKARREATDYKQAVYRTASAKADEKNKKYRDRLDEMAKQSMERREITARMREARRVLSYLNTMLYHPTKQKHVPESLQALVDKTLRAADPKQFGINRDHIREMSELAGKIRKLESKAGRTTAEQETLDAMKTEYEKLEADTISVKRQAEALMTAFEQYVKSTTDGDLIDKNMLEGLRQTVTEIEEAPLNEMTLKSLQAVEKIYTVIYHQVNTANQAFATEKAANIDQMATEANTQVKNSKELKFLSPRSREWAALAGVRSFIWKNMKPLTVFEAIGSDKLMEIFRRVLDGEDVWITDILEAKKALDEAKKEFGYNKWNLKERREVTTADGSKVSLTIGEMMSLYAYKFREQAEDHLSVGGFVFAPDAKAIEKFKGSKALYETHLNDQTPHRMRPEDIAKMSGMLTEEQRAYARAVQEYLTSLGKKGNEVSSKLYGIDLFKETAYFPIKSSHDYIETHTGKSGDPNIKSRGTFKETVPRAGNPIVLEDFMEVVGDHVNTMAIYHAFVLPVEDLTRIWNYTPVNIKRDADGKAILDKNGMPVADTEGEAGYNSLKAEITKKYGKEANDYILQLLRDLNGGARRESAASILDKGLTAFKRSATMLSLSVIVQQPTSIIRAMAYVDAKHFTGASFIPWETVKKYAPVAAIKEMGGFDTGTGARTSEYINAKQYDSIKDAAKAAVTPEIYGGDPNVRAEAFGWMTGKADEVSWRYLFGAIVNEQAEKLGKAKDSEAVLKAAGERFAEVVRRTQVYDSTLTRSEYMRSKDGLMKMATAFGAEPTTVVSMVADAIIKAERGDKTFLRKSAAGIALSVIANAAVASLIYAMRDDDEDETIPEKYVQSLTSELIEGFNPLEYLPVARDIMSMLKGYEIERSDMALIGNLMEQVEMITSSKRSVPDKIFGVTGAVSAFFGLPVTNVYRDLKGLVKTGQSFTNAEEQTGAGLGHAMGDAVRGQFNLFSKLFGAESGNAYELYTAYVRGDTAHYERVKARYKTPQAAEMALRTELRDNDKRISEAAEARLSGDLAVYESIVDQIESEGIFDRNMVIRAINNEVSELKRAAEKGELVPKDETGEDDEETAESLYKSSDLNAALERGDTDDFAAIMADMVQDKVAAGKTEAQAKSSVKSAITAYWKKQYLSGYQDTETRKRIIAILTETGLYGSRNDVATMCEGWVRASK